MGPGAEPAPGGSALRGESVLSRFRLDGKVAIVTGVGPAMGRDFALALAEAGADVCVSARSRPVIEGVAAEVEALGRRALAVTADATDSAQIDALVERTVAELGRLDVMCNHAGSGAPKLPLLETDDETWEASLALTLNSVVYGTRAAARAMVAQGAGGAIVNTSSICSLGVVPNMVAYSTAKAAVNHFTRFMAVEFAPHGIRVNALLPGTFAVQRVTPEVQDWLHSVTPMKRPGAPEEIAPALLYLASDASSYVTGETLTIAGGGFVSGA